MGPKKDGWEYAGDADTETWHTWKDHFLPEKSSEFEYNADAPEVGPKEFPEVGYQENPDKE